MHLPNPVIRSHYGNGFIKQYVRDHLILRTEAATNNVNDYGVNKAVENLPSLREKLSAINDNYQNVQQDILETFIDRGQLRQTRRADRPAERQTHPGLKLDHPRQLALMHALVRFAHVAAGSTPSPPRKSTRTSSRHSAVPASRLQPGLAALRPVEAPGQRAGRETAALPPIPPAAERGYSIWLVFLKLFERIYAPLTAGLLSPITRRPQTATTTAIAARSPLSARRR